ncbi:MAG: hypothetical protein NTV33_09250 [Coprothermobacterota bacterium]|jgi:hypothetical protein|nr:hypothetical protein [Coprothermobacterota bacterium]
MRPGALYRTVFPILAAPLHIAHVNAADLTKTSASAIVRPYQPGMPGFFQKPDQDFEEWLVLRSKLRPVLLVSKAAHCETHRSLLVVGLTHLEQEEVARFSERDDSIVLPPHIPQLPYYSRLDFSKIQFIERNLLLPMEIRIREESFRTCRERFASFLGHELFDFY